MTRALSKKVFKTPAKNIDPGQPVHSRGRLTMIETICYGLNFSFPPSRRSSTNDLFGYQRQSILRLH